MRSTDERIAAVKARSRTMQIRRHRRRGIVVTGLSTAACLVIIVGLSAYIPSVLGDTPAVWSETTGVYGSIIASGGMLGFVVIGILAFCLGVALTLLCVKLRDRRKDLADGAAAAFNASAEGDDESDPK